VKKRQHNMPWVRWSTDDITEVQTKRIMTERIFLLRRLWVRILYLTTSQGNFQNLLSSHIHLKQQN